MKKPLFVLAAAALAVPVVCGLVAHAQNAAGPMQSRLARIAAQLHLTPQQETQAAGIIAQARAQAQAIRADHALTPDQRRGQMMELGLATRAQISALLTPSQRQQAGQMVRQRLERLADRLGLTSDQRTQIKAIITDGIQQAKAVRQDATLTPDQKHTQVRTIMQTTRQQALALLTPAQRQQWEAIKAAHGGA